MGASGEGTIARARVPAMPYSAFSHVHPFDQVLVRWGRSPLVLFFAGLFLESVFLQVLSGALLVGGAAWSAWIITRPSSKEWRYWRVYDQP